tara:strand:- start:647 stop:1075 length:429 start_codon:yes stop_codon:yes gene_type:complete
MNKEKIYASIKSRNKGSKLFRKITSKKISDPRGSTFKIKVDKQEILFLHMHKGAFRGGHYHNRKTTHIVIYGNIIFEFVDPITMERNILETKPMDVIQIPKGIAHLLKANDESLFLEPINDKILTWDYAPQRNKVLKFLKNE